MPGSTVSVIHSFSLLIINGWAGLAAGAASQAAQSSPSQQRQPI